MQAASLPYAPGMLREPSIPVTPSGYRFGETRYASTIFSRVSPEKSRDLYAALVDFRFAATELHSTDERNLVISDRFQSLLTARGWQTSIIEVKMLEENSTEVSAVSTSNHENGMFGAGPVEHGKGGLHRRFEWDTDACPAAAFRPAHGRSSGTCALGRSSDREGRKVRPGRAQRPNERDSSITPE